MSNSYSIQKYIILILALCFNYQIILKFEQQFKTQRALSHAVSLAQEKNSTLKKQLSAIESQKELFSHCSIGHESLARYRFNLRKESESYIPLTTGTEKEEDKDVSL